MLCACSTNNIDALMSGELDIYTHATMARVEKKVDRKIAEKDFQGARAYLYDASYSDVVLKRLRAKIDSKEKLHKEMLAMTPAEIQAKAQAQAQKAAKAKKKKSGWLGKSIALASGAVGLSYAAKSGASADVIGKVGGALAADILTDGSTGALQQVTDEYKATAAAANQSSSDTSASSLRPNMLKTMGARCNSDPQVSSMCQAANAYYDNYVRVANKGEVDPSQLYEAHRIQAMQAMEYFQNNQVETGIDLTQPVPPQQNMSPKVDAPSPIAKYECNAAPGTSCVTPE